MQKTPHILPLRASYRASFLSSLKKRCHDISTVYCIESSSILWHMFGPQLRNAITPQDIEGLSVFTCKRFHSWRDKEVTVDYRKYSHMEIWISHRMISFQMMLSLNYILFLIHMWDSCSMFLYRIWIRYKLMMGSLHCKGLTKYMIWGVRILTHFNTLELQ